MTARAVDQPDLASIAAVFADARRIRVLMALADGRELPAGRLAEEAGVAASTVSNHLARLLDHGLVTVTTQGRHRYYRLAGPHVEGVLEALARLAPPTPIKSLRQHTRARALRAARTCYRHLAGELGVHLFRVLLDHGWIIGGDGLRCPEDRLSSPGTCDRYRLTRRGADALADWGVDGGVLNPARPLRYCVDWTEQAHHLAGPLGTALTEQLLERGWLDRGTVPRSIVVTAEGWAGLKALGCTAFPG